jgi:hypothetical protein
MIGEFGSSTCDLIDILSWHLPPVIETRHEEYQSGQVATRPEALLLDQPVPYITSIMINIKYGCET